MGGKKRAEAPQQFKHIYKPSQLDYKNNAIFNGF